MRTRVLARAVRFSWWFALLSVVALAVLFVTGCAKQQQDAEFQLLESEPADPSETAGTEGAGTADTQPAERTKATESAEPGDQPETSTEQYPEATSEGAEPTTEETEGQTEASGEPVMVTTSTFEEEVLTSDVPVLVDFYADWCMPCKALHPRLEKVAKDYAGRAKVAQVDVDESPDLAREYSVRGIPALFVIRGGEVVDTAVGLQSQQALEEMLDRALE
ncbi:MAG: thioredoxin [Armatimonadota bacterium]|nr:thioredoxin [Armatimonadota bacterium]